MLQNIPEPKEVLNRVLDRFRHTASEGSVADYIPALGKANPKHYGVVIATADGRIIEVGDTDVPFAIEWISKVV